MKKEIHITATEMALAADGTLSNMDLVLKVCKSKGMPFTCEETLCPSAGYKLMSDVLTGDYVVTYDDLS